MFLEALRRGFRVQSAATTRIKTAVIQEAGFVRFRVRAASTWIVEVSNSYTSKLLLSSKCQYRLLSVIRNSHHCGDSKPLQRWSKRDPSRCTSLGRSTLMSRAHSTGPVYALGKYREKYKMMNIFIIPLGSIQVTSYLLRLLFHPKGMTWSTS